DVYYGSQTVRAIENFPISGLRLPRAFIAATATIKRAAAEVNAALGLLEPNIAQAIARAAQEVVDGTWDAQFPIDAFQMGAGTARRSGSGGSSAPTPRRSPTTSSASRTRASDSSTSGSGGPPPAPV